MESKEHRNGSKDIHFGVIADLQYWDGPPFKNRYFRASKEKLKKAIQSFNSLDLDFVINLGDTIDRNYLSFVGILVEFENLNSKLYHVLGNHDFEVEENQFDQVHQILEIPEYYSFVVSDWRFIVLNGNQISTFSNVEGSANYMQAENCLREMEKEGKINAQSYNGGIGHDQLLWLDAQLKEADASRQLVIIFCHYPIYPDNKHNLLNAEELKELIQRSNLVKAWFCGHNHKGNYGQLGNIHFLTVKGMVEGATELAYATVTLGDQLISINGYGNEISARLSIEPLHL